MPSDRRTFLATSGLALAGLAGCVSFGPPSADGTWPRRSVDAANTGHSPTDGPTESLYEVWSRDRPRGGVATTSPVVGDGRVYLAYSREPSDESAGSWVEAFDAATGESAWTTELFRTDEFHYFYHSDSLVLDGDSLLVQTKAGLTALGTDGEPHWTVPNLGRSQQKPDAVPPVVTEGLVVAGTYGTTRSDDDSSEAVFGLDPADGDERWRTEFPELSGMWQLAAANGTVYVPFTGSNARLVALDLADGAESWRRPIPVNGTPSVSDGRLFLPLYEQQRDTHSIAAFDAGTGERLWRKRVGARWSDSGLAVANGLVYGVADRGLEARAVETGELVWRFDGTDSEEISLWTTPAVAENHVYVYGVRVTDDTYGRLFVLDAETGERRTAFALGENRTGDKSVPAVTEGLVFVNTNRGRLCALSACETELAERCLVG